MQSKIVYDRKVREYRLVDLSTGAIVDTAPSGKEHKAGLELTQLKLEAALNGVDVDWLLGEISQRVGRHPKLQGRAFRAGLILAGGHVRHDGGPGRFYADSLKTDEVYTVVANGRRACGCKDFDLGRCGHQHGAPVVGGTPTCKHLLAADLLIAWESHRRDTALPVESPRGRSKLWK